MLRASRARSFAAEYEQTEGPVLGSGAAGAVLRCKHRASGAMVRDERRDRNGQARRGACGGRRMWGWEGRKRRPRLSRALRGS